MNCISGFVPMKYDTSLNESEEKTDKELITKCCNKKNNKKNPERAINIFLPMDDFIMF